MIYLDNAATTKPLDSAINQSLVFNNELFYNASAKYHGGVEVNKRLKNTKETFKKVFGGYFDVIFTSCGSESNNTAIRSYLKRGNAVTTLGEHSAVYSVFDDYKKQGYDSRFAKINSDGSVDVDNLLSLIDNNTVFVSVVHVNNETGAINDVNYIAKQCKKINPRLIFHSDGVQAFTKIPYKLSSDIDLYSVSAHKVGGLKGVGALLKNKNLKSLKPLIIGGGQEDGLRSGTENVFGISVFERAVIDKTTNFNEYYNRAVQLKNAFLSNISNEVKIISSENSSPYIISISAVGLKGEVLQHMLEDDGVIVGTGSACSSKRPHSRVLQSAGYDSQTLDGVIRISFGVDTTVSDVIFATQKINENVLKLKRTIK